ncbi:MAG: glycosyltransferase [Anaerolineae bacterium]
MRIGFISTRLKGTDGVSLEVEKWARVLRRMGHDVFFCAGELGGYASGGTLIPQLHFHHQSIGALSRRAFGENAEQDGEELCDEIYATADEMRAPLRRFIRFNQLDFIIVQNALTIPMNLPLGVCLTGLIAELGINTIAHHHDFFWERQRYQTNAILDLLDTTFPAKLPTIQHVTINTIAQQRLKVRRGIDSIVIPNVHDFATPPPGIDAYNSDFRETLGLTEDDLFILQPTRVIRRKGIESSLELVHRLALSNAYLFITHRADDEGLSYWHWLKREAGVMNVDLRMIDHIIGAERSRINGHKIYSLWDAYPHADLVTYPSTYEGFGNALLEAIYFKRLIVVNRYPVYNADIGPLGFEFVELDGFVDEAAVEKAHELLNDPEQAKAMAEKNYAIAQEHFSLEVVERKLRELVATTIVMRRERTMRFETALRDDTRQRLAEIGRADLMVGIPSYNNAGTIGHVVEQAARGMVEHFPELKPVLVNSDGGSPDNTMDVVRNTGLPAGVEAVVGQYQGISGKGSAFRAIFEAAEMLGVKACVVVDSDLRSITPGWIRRLAGPIVEGGYDYVTPFYSRHKYDGTITNNIAYPMTRALYGVDVRQPIGGDFGFSGELAKTYAAKDVWDTNVARFGIDIWMTTTAINEGFKVAQTYLGAKIHDAKDPAAHLGPMFRQVVGTLFMLMRTYADRWPAVEEVEPAPILGEPLSAEPEPVGVTLGAMIDKFQAGFEENAALWQQVMGAANFDAVAELARLSYDAYGFPVDLWARIVFDFAVAYNHGVAGATHDEIVESMTALYYGRTAGLVKTTWDMTTAQAEEVVRAQAKTFLRQKPYLVERWGEQE